MFGRTYCQLRAASVPVIKHCRHVSNTANKVLVSTSKNIYENLALETWLFQNTDLERQSVLLMWRNTPAVVCGRHQNPWLECNIPMASKLGVDVARRQSGGGTVYHDEGNLNCSFLMHSSSYDRKRNLQLVVDAIKDRWPDTPLEINRREDIILDGYYKISGTASRLSGKKTYHHFTLLLDVDRQILENILTTSVMGAVSKATPSVRVRVCNLSDYLLNADFDSLVTVVTDKFLHDSKVKPVQYVDPMDSRLFPGVEDHYNELKSWDWIYGKTPEFSINRQVHKAIGNLENNVNIKLVVKKGLIHNLEVSVWQRMGVCPEAFTSLKLGMEETRLDRVSLSTALSQVKMGWIFHKHYRVETRELLDWVLMCVLETLLQFTGSGGVARSDNGDSDVKRQENSL